MPDPLWREQVAYRDVDELTVRLGRLGWRADVKPVPPGWPVGEASVS